jgi:exopolysaccharide production protein ExoQ
MVRVELHIASLFGLGLSSYLALFLTIALIVWLFRRDIRERPNITGGLWLPLIWLVLGCSRSVSAWLNIFGLPVSGGASVEEGSPLDAWFYFALIIAGFCVLAKRQVRLSEVVSHNGWLLAFLVFCLISIIWSDFPFIALKRWIKVLGHPIMALIVLTEPDPEEALARLMKRCAYVVVPVSILFIKYYPELGRGFSPWGGAETTGITTNKNILGAVCLILGYFFFWYLLQTWQRSRSIWRRNELRLIAGFGIGIWWLFSQAHSATAVTAFLVGASIVMFVASRAINKNLGTYLLAALVILIVAEAEFGISGHLSESLGRGSELSGRRGLWTALLDLHTNPVVGAGFESFWLGDTPRQLEGIFFFIPNEAHNGYLETYLTLGIIGVFLLIGLFVATFRKIRLELFRNFEWGRYRLGFLVALILYNWTEAAFKTLSPLWFVFYLIATDYPRIHLATAEAPVGLESSEESEDLVYAKEQ